VEYHDYVTKCTDCGAALVDDLDVARTGIAPESCATEPRGYREPAILAAANEEQEARAREARVDVLTGVCFLALGVMLLLGGASSRLPFVLVTLPLGYGLVRLLRGLGRR
jgi:hypothetical protein